MLEGCSASITNLANVADIIGAKGGDPYGDILRLDQFAAYSVQIANNSVEAGSVGGLDMSATNGVNIANFDLSDMSGNANIGISQQTYDVKQTIQNGVRAHGSVAGAALSGVNLGNVMTFAVPEVQ